MSAFPGGRAEGSLQCVVSWWIRGLQQEGKAGEGEGEDEGQRVARVGAMALFEEIAGHLPARETRGVWSVEDVDVNGAWESCGSPRPILDHDADTVTSHSLPASMRFAVGAIPV